MKFTSQSDIPSSNGENTEMKNGKVLTRREKEILVLVATGYTAQEIAEQLFVSIDTVETHRKNIVKKFGARNTVDAVVKAMRKGLIE